jgi:hypothetical protein
MGPDSERLPDSRSAKDPKKTVPRLSDNSGFRVPGTGSTHPRRLGRSRNPCGKLPLT